MMCNLSLGVEDRGVEKGMERGLAQGMERALRNLIKNTGVSADEALAMLEIPQADWQKYKFLLAEK